MRALMLAALAWTAAGAAQAETLRIAVVTGRPGACRALEGQAPSGEKAYYQHLKLRLAREIQKCPFADRAAAAKALSAGQVDIAVLDPGAFAPIKATSRAIMTVRPAGSLNRIPVVVATKSSSPAKDLASLRGGAVVFGGPVQAALATPRQVLADQGLDAGFFATERVAADGDAAAKVLRAGGADAMVLNAAAWQRLCRGATPKAQPCADLRVLWRGRQRATLAMVVRRDMPDELKFRLIGIHVGMHLEAKPAFAWGSSWIPKGVEFEPTEADALVIAAR